MTLVDKVTDTTLHNDELLIEFDNGLLLLAYKRSEHSYWTPGTGDVHIEAKTICELVPINNKLRNFRNFHDHAKPSPLSLEYAKLNEEAGNVYRSIMSSLDVSKKTMPKESYTKMGCGLLAFPFLAIYCVARSAIEDSESLPGMILGLALTPLISLMYIPYAFMRCYDTGRRQDNQSPIPEALLPHYYSIKNTEHVHQDSSKKDPTLPISRGDFFS